MESSQKKTHSSSPATHLPIPKKLPSDSQYHNPAELLKQRDHTRARAHTHTHTHTQHHSLTFRMMRQCCKFRQCESHPEPHFEGTHRRLGTQAGGAQLSASKNQLSAETQASAPRGGRSENGGGGERPPPGKRGDRPAGAALTSAPRRRGGRGFPFTPSRATARPSLQPSRAPARAGRIEEAGRTMFPEAKSRRKVAGHRPT